SPALNHDGFFLALLIVLQLLPVLQFRRDPYQAATTHHNLAFVSYGKSYPASSYLMHGPRATFQLRLVAGSRLYTILCFCHLLLQKIYLLAKTDNDLVQHPAGYTSMAANYFVFQTYLVPPILKIKKSSHPIKDEKT